MSKTMFDVDASRIFALFKGEPGTRKSTQALSFALGVNKPLYFFSFDLKMNGLLVPMNKWNIPQHMVEYDDYTDWNAAEKKLKEFQLNCKYGGIVVDTITAMSDVSLRQVRRTKKVDDGKGKIVGGIEVNSIEDYNAESSAIGELMFLLKDIQQYHGIPIIMCAHVVKAEYHNTTSNTTHISRTIVTAAKKNAHKIPGYCTEVYHFNIKTGFIEGQGGNYTILTEHTGDDYARTALNLPREIELRDQPLYPTWIKPAIDKLKGESKPKTPTQPIPFNTK